MVIIKKINTSAAIALDSNGNEIVVLGKGIGFPKMPYELKDVSVIERTFYDLDPHYVEAISSLPKEILLISAEVYELAQVELDCKLNSNLVVTLADHLNFAIERTREGIAISSPIAYDVMHLYPIETEIGKVALKKLKKQYDIILPDDEAINIALHLINGEIETKDSHSLVNTVKIINEVTKLFENYLEIEIDKSSYYFSRFQMHIRYLIQRLSSEKDKEEETNVELFDSMAKSYPKEYMCAVRISNYLKNTWNLSCNKEEMLYLLIHIIRLSKKN